MRLAERAAPRPAARLRATGGGGRRHLGGGRMARRTPRVKQTDRRTSKLPSGRGAVILIGLTLASHSRNVNRKSIISRQLQCKSVRPAGLTKTFCASPRSRADGVMIVFSPTHQLPAAAQRCRTSSSHTNSAALAAAAQSRARNLRCGGAGRCRPRAGHAAVRGDCRIRRPVAARRQELVDAIRQRLGRDPARLLARGALGNGVPPSRGLAGPAVSGAGSRRLDARGDDRGPEFVGQRA